jgi:hypothetical protein
MDTRINTKLPKWLVHKVRKAKQADKEERYQKMTFTAYLVETIEAGLPLMQDKDALVR